jgi:hypothetical protein
MTLESSLVTRGKIVALVQKRTYLVAKHPVPLSISTVAHGSICKVQIRCIVGVKTLESCV